MITKLFSIYDTKVEAYGPPFHLHTLAEAKRAFAEVSRDKTNRIGKYPEDHVLFELGEFDDHTGKFTSLDAPVAHGLALEYCGRAAELTLNEHK